MSEPMHAATNPGPNPAGVGVCWSRLAYSPTADGLAAPGMLTVWAEAEKPEVPKNEALMHWGAVVFVLRPAGMSIAEACGFSDSVRWPGGGFLDGWPL